MTSFQQDMTSVKVVGFRMERLIYFFYVFAFYNVYEYINFLNEFPNWGQIFENSKEFKEPAQIQVLIHLKNVCVSTNVIQV